MSAPRRTSDPPALTATDPRDIDLFGLFVADRRRDPRSSTSGRGAPSTRRDSPRGLRSARAAPSIVDESPSSPQRPPRGERGFLARGAILDKYRIEALVGTGGFAAVYRATHLLLRVPVAIKLIRPRVLSRDPGVTRQLLEEARYAARITHPNVVRIHDVTHSDEITFIVMEYIDGQSLAKAIEHGGSIAPASAVAIAIDVAEGLRAGLEEGLIHRDIKPANILLTRSGRARIVDFGLAYAESSPETLDRAPQPAQVVGTRGYMAPEQARDPRRVDFRADVYALGVTIRQALTGVGPTLQHQGRVARDVPAPLVPLLRRMTAPSPDDRPTSYDVLVAALRDAARALRP